MATLKNALLRWMAEHLEEAKEMGLNELINMYGVGEVNSTKLAEETAWDSGLISDPETVLGDETHVIWDAAIDASEEFENQLE